MNYVVILAFQFPAHDERRGIRYEVESRSKAEAIMMARKQAERDGHIPCTGKRRYIFTALDA